MNAPRVLVAGIGNIFLGDDAFGCEVAQRLLRRPLLDGVRVVDFGIRGIDLAYALLEPLGAVILVDALPRGGAPGTLYVIEPDRQTESHAGPADMHSLDPLKVLSLAKTMGGPPQRIFVVGCEPTALDSGDGAMGLSPQVQAAVDEAVKLVAALVAKIRKPEELQQIKDEGGMLARAVDRHEHPGDGRRGVRAPRR